MEVSLSKYRSRLSFSTAAHIIEMTIGNPITDGEFYLYQHGVKNSIWILSLLYGQQIVLTSLIELQGFINKTKYPSSQGLLPCLEPITDKIHQVLLFFIFIIIIARAIWGHISDFASVDN